MLDAERFELDEDLGVRLAEAADQLWAQIRPHLDDRATQARVEGQ